MLGLGRFWKVFETAFWAGYTKGRQDRVGGRLTGPKIRQEIAVGNIKVTPYDPKRVEPASIDLTLGKQIRVYARFEQALKQEALAYPEEWRRGTPWTILDCRTKNRMVAYEMAPGERFVLVPGVLYLMHTRERIHTTLYEADVTGKSSLARMGIVVHQTAGYIDPGFDGQYTLEVTVAHPTAVYEGMPFCQVRFSTLDGEIEDYRKRGNYTGEKAQGAQPSQSWRQR